MLDLQSQNYGCHLGPTLCLLTPQAYLPVLDPDDDWHLNDDISVVHPARSPVEAAAPFVPDSWTVWVSDPATRIELPYFLDGPLAGAVLADRDWRDLDDAQRRNLVLCDLLVSPNHARDRVAEWRWEASRLAEGFAQLGYAVVRRLIPPLHVATLRQHYRLLSQRGMLHRGDAQSPRRSVIHNEPLARYFHRQLTGVVSEIVGHAVKPAYVYSAIYEGGAVLERHVDREQCAYTLSLAVDFSPEPTGDTPWPLGLDLPAGTGRATPVYVWQGLGDGILFRGRELPHFRDPLPQECRSTSLFFHYVDAAFTGTLD